MSRENVEVVRRIYEAWNQGDPGAQYIDPTMELQQTDGLLGGGGTFHGHEGVLEAGRKLREGLRQFRWMPDDFIPAPDGRLVVPWSAQAVGRASNAPVEVRLVHVWTIQDGLALRMVTFEDLEQALQAVGLRE